MGKEARRQARQTLALERPVKLHQPQGYGESSRTTWERMNTPFSLGYSGGGHAPAPAGLHPLASELDVNGAPFKHKPNAYYSRMWRKAFGRGAARMSQKGFVRVPEGVGMTFQQWRDAGYPKFEWLKVDDHITPDDQIIAYARKD